MLVINTCINDSAKNVLCPINCEGSDSITVFSAHTDTVFPDREPMPFTETEDKYLCPAVGDDTASLALLLLAAKYLRENGFEPKNGVLLVCNSCEEGLGNLYGIRQILKIRGKTCLILRRTHGKIAVLFTSDVVLPKDEIFHRKLCDVMEIIREGFRIVFRFYTDPYADAILIFITQTSQRVKIVLRFIERNMRTGTK